MHILMVAAENGAFPGGKVGGIADVIRDVPKALAESGNTVSVITPGYQSFSVLPSAKLVTNLTVTFRGKLESVSLFQLDDPSHNNSVNHWVMESPLFSPCGKGVIYCDDDFAPFATDADKFAFFCSAVCHAVIAQAITKPDIIHLHDWHTALILFLREYDALFKPLQSIPVVYTIHNLSIQGQRPFQDEHSSLRSWFPTINYSKKNIADPILKHCVNMMRIGINLADKVHVVSKTYAKEILKPSDQASGVFGGENLEQDLLNIHHNNKLFGILNGCEYPTHSTKALNIGEFSELANSCLLEWISEEDTISSAFYFAQQRLQSWMQNNPSDAILVASISRLTSQKVKLLEIEGEKGLSSIESVLAEIGDGYYILLGAGDSHYERFMTKMMVLHSNFIFLKGYSEQLANELYKLCDLFFMPSSYEPCGISQLLAMRAGKPCLVNQVGGLADTVKDKVNGFTFSGKTKDEQVLRMRKRLKDIINMRKHEPEKWEKICKAAKDSRFTWAKSITAYQEKLYQL